MVRYQGRLLTFFCVGELVSGHVTGHFERQ
jgi:hypothetical protein